VLILRATMNMAAECTNSISELVKS